MTPRELLDRLARLIPQPRRHRHRYHGVFAPEAVSLAGMAQRLGLLEKVHYKFGVICLATAGISKTLVYVEEDLGQNTAFMLPVPLVSAGYQRK